MRGTIVTAKVEGVEHRIPESWIVGFCRGQASLRQLTAADAVAWWHQQWKLERQHGR